MKTKTKFQIANNAILFAMIFWFAETAYFGWNMEAQSFAERICDWIVQAIIAVGFGFYISEIFMYLAGKIISEEEDHSHIISGKFTDQQADFLETIIHEDGAKDQIEAIAWCIDACKKIEEEHGVDACHVGFHGLPRSDDMIMKKIHELLGQDYRVEFVNAIHGCITVHLLKYKDEQLIRSDHTITLDDINYIFPFTKRLCIVLDELKGQIDELISKQKP